MFEILSVHTCEIHSLSVREFARTLSTHQFLSIPFINYTCTFFSRLKDRYDKKSNDRKLVILHCNQGKLQREIGGKIK